LYRARARYWSDCSKVMEPDASAAAIRVSLVGMAAGGPWVAGATFDGDGDGEQLATTMHATNRAAIRPGFIRIERSLLATQSQGTWHVDVRRLRATWKL
jgi:hypothetical protein